MKKTIATVLALILSLGIITVALATANSPQVIDPDILDKMDAIHAAMSNDFSGEIEIVDIASSTSNDTYGGIYYEDGKIVLLTTESVSQPSAEINAYQNDKDIILRKCDFTYAALEQAWNLVMGHIDNIPGFISLGIAPIENRVVLTVEDADLLNQKIFSWLPDEIVKIEESAPMQPTASIGAGNSMKNSTRGSSSSCCVGVVTNSGTKGLIIQGHQTLVGDTIKNGSGSTIGSVTARVQNTTDYGPDASFVTLNSGNSVTNTIPEITNGNVIVAGRAYENMYAGMPVYMRGSKTQPFSSGEVTQVSLTYYWDEARDNQRHYYTGVRASYPSISGDSGGFVFFYTTSGPVWCGVQSGGGETVDYSVFARATDVASYFNCLPN